MSSDSQQGPRSRSRRKRDVLAKLASDVDLWVASADEAGNAYLVPLSYCWHEDRITIATPRSSPTGRNLIRARSARVALGPTRDVVIVEGPVEVIPIGADPVLEDLHAESTGFDPRTLEREYVYLRITPRRVQAWREADELEGRELMRDGSWLDDGRPPPAG
jgi:hypothetical protein